MNHYVPEFDLEDDYAIPTSSSLTRPKKSAMPEDDIMELLWQNGQVVMQSQAQRSSKKSVVPKFDDAVLPAGEQSSAREIRPSQDHHHQQHHQHQQQQQQHLFLQEDEMASWLHYPLHDTNFDNDFCADLLYPSSSATCLTSATTKNATPSPSAAASTTPTPPCYSSHPIQNPETSAPITAARPPIPPSRRAEVVQNFSHFSRHKARVSAAESIPANSRAVMAANRETTVVDSSETPAAISDSRASEAAMPRSALGTSSADNACRTIGGAAVAGGSNDDNNNNNNNNNNNSSNNYMTTCEMKVTSSPGGSSASAEPIPPKPPVDDRKRKGRDEEAECQSEDGDFESAEAKKPARGSSSTKRSRAAEVHNLSERRRRDRINEKMRALQELIPRCNKSDKASMLDEAIEYLKSLQLQVQMMSMGCFMVPMMFPGVQQYMPPMGMGMGMGMGMNRSMMPFPGVLTSPSLPTPASAAAHLGPRFPMPPYQMPLVPSPDPSRIHASSHADPMLSTMVPHDPNQPRVSRFTDPYQQYLGLHQMQIPLPQNQAMAQPSSSRPSAGEGPDNIDNHQTGT